MAKKIDVFRPGTRQDSKGRTVTITAADLAATAAAYDPKLKISPFVIGHPAQDGPAYGYPGSFEFSEGKLRAVPEKIVPEFAEAVNTGCYPAVSMSWYPPGHPRNPKPDVWYPKHIGFFGAQQTACTGLDPAEFSESLADEDGVHEFMEMADMQWALRGIVEILRNQKNKLIEEKGAEEAEKVIPEWTLESILRESLRPTTDSNLPMFSEPRKEGQMTEEELKKKAEELAAKEAELKKQEEETKAAQKTTAKKGIADFCEELVKAGRILPAEKNEAIAALEFAEGVNDGDVYEFSEADGSKKTSTPGQLLRGILGRIPKKITYGAVATGDPAEFAEGDDDAARGAAIAASLQPPASA